MFSKLSNAFSTYKVVLVSRMLHKKSIKLSKKVRFRKNVHLVSCKGNKGQGQISIGEGVFINNNSSITSRKKVVIGSNTIIGENVKIYDHNHRFNLKNKNIKDQGFTEDSIIIGKNCWIGSNVVILKGVKIGNNCVIGAGAVVRKSVPNNTILSFDNNSLVLADIRFK